MTNMTTTQTTTDLTAAIELLDAEPQADGSYVYYASETTSHWRVSVEAMGDLARRLAAGEPDAYSHWCAEPGVGGEELPRAEDDA